MDIQPPAVARVWAQAHQTAGHSSVFPSIQQASEHALFKRLYRTAQSLEDR